MRKKKTSGASIVGIVAFFFTVAFLVAVAVGVYGAITARTENRAVVAGVMLSVVIFLSVVCTVIDFVRRKITVDVPVERILEATDKIAAGDFSVRMDVRHSFSRYDEFDYIMENLNKMVAQLSETEVLHTDFISNVSHELKTPLAVIRSYATSIQSERIDGETRKRYAETLVSASERLTALITNILKLNKLENQQLTPEYEKFRLDEQLARTVISYEELIENKNLILECELDETEIFSSPDCLEIVWNNLLSNAVKFTKEGGTIGVSLKKDGEKIIVKVSDTGCGISKETGAHIFEKFYQGDTSHSREGNGLGLALVKKVIDVIGGKISVESEVDKGSTFTVTLKG